MNTKTITINKKAGFEYHLTDKYEAGIVLKGSEVKSIREGKVNIKGSYIRLIGNEIYIIGMHIGDYSHADSISHENITDRKLLLHRKEINKIAELLNQKGRTMIPMSLYFKKDLVKVKFAVGTGKKKWDKRQDKMDQDIKRQLDRQVKKINNR